MQPGLQRRVQRYGWDRAAAAYEPSWQEQLAPAHELMLQMAGLRPGERVLDVACGTGLVSFRAAAAVGAGGAVVGDRHLGRDGAGGCPRGVAARRGPRAVRARRRGGPALRRRLLRCRHVRLGADVRPGPRPSAARDAPRAAALRQGGRGGLGCAQRLWLGRDLPDRRRSRRLRRLPAVLPPRHPRHARAQLRGRRLHRRRRRADQDRAALRLCRGGTGRGVSRRPGGAGLQPLRRGDQAGRPCRIPRFHRRLCGGRWLPDPGRVRRCRRPDDRSLDPATTGSWQMSRI